MEETPRVSTGWDTAGRESSRCKFPLAGKHLVVEKRKRKPAWLEQRAVERAEDRAKR